MTFSLALAVILAGASPYASDATRAPEAGTGSRTASRSTEDLSAWQARATELLLVVRLEAPRAARTGTPARLVVRVESPDRREVRVGLGRPPHDFVVEDLAGATVWTWSRRCGPGGNGSGVRELMLVEHVLAPGASLRFEGEWDLTDASCRPVAPGVYRVRGLVTHAGGPPLTTEVAELRVEP
jgi:hypothetical protein